MRVLWICNIMMPQMAQRLKEMQVNGGGWMVSLGDDISREDGVELSIAAPYSGNIIQKIQIDNIMHIAVPHEHMDKCWRSIIDLIKPDIIHLHGTEYSYGKILMEVCPNENYVVSIQGLVSIYAKHYFSNLPWPIIKKKSFRDILKHGSVYNEQKLFVEKGKCEESILKRTKHIIGRTNWDKACAHQINPNAEYHYCSESLRTSFYHSHWDLNQCEKYSIFLSQANYPIKGLHFVLQALPQIIKEYPNAHLYVAGRNIVATKTMKEKLKQTYYGKYLQYLIDDLHLESYITFTGSLDEAEICERMKKSHVFLSASSIENSPNSLGEAMLLGVPCVSSDVGGVSDMLVHKEEGFVYPADEYYMISYYVTEIFKSDDLALKFSQNARSHAKITHDRKINLNTILKIYHEVNELPR